MEKDLIEPEAFLLQDPGDDFHPVFPEDPDPASRHFGIGVQTPHEDPPDLLFQNDLGTGRRLPVVAAGLQRHIQIRSLAVFLRAQQRVAFGMVSAVPFMISFADDPSVLYNDTSHHGIGGYPSLSQPGKRQSPVHELFPVRHENLLSSTFRQKEKLPADVQGVL